MINLENFDPLCGKSHFLDSPRSLDACRRLGFSENELLKKNWVEIKETTIPEQFKDDSEHFLEIKAEFFEKKRLEKVDLLRKVRDKIIEEGFEREFEGGDSKEKDLEEENQRFLEKERKRIEKMVERKVFY